MQSKARLLGHPVHQMLIVFPGPLATAVIFDVIHIVVERPVTATVSYWIIAAGIIGGLVAAPFGWIDWFYIPRGSRALVLSFSGPGLALVTGWLGGELVDRLGIGVDEGANVNAPSSLSRQPPHESRGYRHTAKI
jgi:uncharacterized membrane protein